MQPGIVYVRVFSIRKETDKADREKESHTEDRITRIENRSAMNDISVKFQASSKLSMKNRGSVNTLHSQVPFLYNTQAQAHKGINLALAWCWVNGCPMRKSRGGIDSMAG